MLVEEELWKAAFTYTPFQKIKFKDYPAKHWRINL